MSTPASARRAVVAADLPGIETQFVDVDGVAVHTASVGPRDAMRGLVLLHHFYGNVATWRRVLRLLGERDIAAVAIDRPGFGWSQRLPAARAEARTPNPYSRAFAVHAVHEVVTATGWQDVVLVGSSMGGTLAIETAASWAARHDPPPPDLAHLVLLSPALTGDVGLPPPLRPFLRAPWITRTARPLVDRLSRRMDLERVTGGWHDRSLADDSDVAAYAEPTADPLWSHGLWQVMTVDEPPSLRATAGALDVRATVVSGRHDRTIRPRWNHRTAALLDAELVQLDTGHTPQEEAPDVVAELLATTLGAPPSA